MHTELRILNGLHRGGVLPLDESTLLIGAHEDADIVLVDPSILDHHASLQKTDDGWVVTADSGAVFGTEQASAQMLLDLQLGDFFRLGETWLVISDAQAAWQSVPTVVASDDALDQIAFDDTDAALPPDAAGAYDSEADQLFSQDPSQEAAAESIPLSQAQSDAIDTEAKTAADAANNLTGSADSGSLVARATRLFKLPRWRKWMIAPVSLFALLSAVAAYAYTAKPSLPKLSPTDLSIDWRADKANSALSLADKAALAARGDAAASASAGVTPVATATVAAAAPAAPAGPVALQSLFRKRMKEADLLQRFDLDLNESAWSMRAHLDDEEGARFERILKTFVAEHKVTFPISAKVGSAESMLPFQIKQIVTGANAGIVTGDGDRIYVGDELLGVKLMAVVDNHLTFMGKRKIEVIW